MTKTVEYRVRPVTRYHVTRFESEDNPSGAGRAGCESLGEYDNESQAFKVSNALSDLEIKMFYGDISNSGKEINLIPATFSDKENK